MLNQLNGVDPFASVYARLGAPPAMPAYQPAAAYAPEFARGPGSGMNNTAPLWHPDNPMFWFAVVLAAAAGAIGFSTTARVGPARAGLAIGD